jgi:hypothetical protein
MPGDEFADLAKANATGCVGIIVGFQNKDSLVAVDPHDCGSYVQPPEFGPLNKRFAKLFPALAHAYQGLGAGERDCIA